MKIRAKMGLDRLLVLFTAQFIHTIAFTLKGEDAAVKVTGLTPTTPAMGEWKFSGVIPLPFGNVKRVEGTISTV